MATTAARIKANQSNAQRSTGPRTPEGKSRSRMNALRHGLTGQVLLMTEENLVAFQAHCKVFVNHYQPVGPIESRLVQKIATLEWRIDRAATHESNMLAMAEFETRAKFDAGDPQINTATTETIAARDLMPTFALISIYEQRLERRRKEALHELKDLQSRRKREEAQPRAPKQEPRPQAAAEPLSPTNQTTSPQIGFVCSSSSVTPTTTLIGSEPRPKGANTEVQPLPIQKT
jgi:hypothetical protein